MLAQLESSLLILLIRVYLMQVYERGRTRITKSLKRLHEWVPAFHPWSQGSNSGCGTCVISTFTHMAPSISQADFHFVLRLYIIPSLFPKRQTLVLLNSPLV